MLHFAKHLRKNSITHYNKFTTLSATIYRYLQVGVHACVLTVHNIFTINFQFEEEIFIVQFGTKSELEKMTISHRVGGF